jgi:hypothetical protein
MSQICGQKNPNDGNVMIVELLSASKREHDSYCFEDDGDWFIYILGTRTRVHSRLQYAPFRFHIVLLPIFVRLSRVWCRCQRVNCSYDREIEARIRNGLAGNGIT